ncbi:TIGR02391 family protein, partial [Steroidobacter sp.]|uniref:TIGR02391 family protein n=1 Tax=Steroidobacter sp. TaxID=1978227 RepID=UPI001A409704
SADVVNEMPTEELAAVVLQHLNHEFQHSNQFRSQSPPRVHLASYCGSESPPYEVDQGKQVRHALAAAFYHLTLTGMLTPDPDNHQHGWWNPTRQALQLQTTKDYARYVQASKYPKGQIHPLVQESSYAEFLRGDYETAVFKAFRSVEIAIRTRGGFASNDIGVPMARKAFHPEHGQLRDATEEGGERQALADLMAGAIGRFKNPTSHRVVGIDDPVVAIEVLQLASLLLRLIDGRPDAS